MSESNGHGPGRVLTIDELLAHTERPVRVASLSEALGEPVHFRVRRLSRAEYLGFLPPPPPEAAGWGEGPAYAAAEATWFEALSPERREARVQALQDVVYRVVAAATLEPRLTVEQARRLGDEADLIALDILRFSGLVRRTEAPAAVAPDPEPVVAGAA